MLVSSSYCPLSGSMPARPVRLLWATRSKEPPARGFAATIGQCRIVFPLSDICANSGADAHVRGRPPGRPLLAPKHPHSQKERDEGVLAQRAPRPGGLPHLISAGISPLGKLCGIRMASCGDPEGAPALGLLMRLCGYVYPRGRRVTNPLQVANLPHLRSLHTFPPCASFN